MCINIKLLEGQCALLLSSWRARGIIIKLLEGQCALLLSSSECQRLLLLLSFGVAGNNVHGAQSRNVQ